MNLVDQIPVSDMYVMETKPTKYLTKLPAKSFALYLYSHQRRVSLVLLLRTRFAAENAGRTVYFMPCLYMGRLYELIVSNEITSTQKKCEEILMSGRTEDDKVIYDDVARKQYYDSPPVQREFLGRSMLTGLSFHRLAILQCPNSIYLHCQQQ